jgi:putative hydroxymethylpyrimidine transport system substrate-binding protein
MRGNFRGNAGANSEEGRMLKRIFIILLIGLFCQVHLAVAKQKQLTVVLDWFVNPDHAPLMVADQQGFYRDQGLQITFVAPADPSDPVKLLAAGKADIAVTYLPQFLLQQKQGLPLAELGVLVAMPLDCLMVLRDGPIKTIKDLKGKRVGYSMGGTGEIMLKTMLQANGLKLQDVQLINVHYSLSQALLLGNVDAVVGVMRNFEPIEIELVGKATCLFYPEENGMPLYDELIFVVNQKNLNDPAFAKFLLATRQGTIYLINHPEESWQKFAKNHPELNNKLNHRVWVATLPRFALRPELIDKNGNQIFENFLTKMVR